MMIEDLDDARQREQERLDQCVAGLRQLADFIEAHPALPVPYGTNLNVFTEDKTELAALARVGNVRWEKHANGEYFYLKAHFAGGHSYEININRAKVCRKVVLGSHVEPAKVVEDVEWICEESLLEGTTP